MTGTSFNPIDRTALLNIARDRATLQNATGTEAACIALPHDGTDSMILRDLARRIAIIEHTVDCTALPTTPRDSAKRD